LQRKNPRNTGCLLNNTCPLRLRGCLHEKKAGREYS